MINLDLPSPPSLSSLPALHQTFFISFGSPRTSKRVFVFTQSSKLNNARTSCVRLSFHLVLRGVGDGDGDGGVVVARS